MMDETFASNLLLRAIVEHRAAELLLTLMDGGSATLNPEGGLVLVGNDIIKQLGGRFEY